MDDQLLLRFLNNSCSDQEEDRIREWLKEDQKNRERLEELTVIWSASGDSNPYAADSDQLNAENINQEWKKLETRIQATASSEGTLTEDHQKEARYGYQKTVGNHKRHRKTYLKLVAILLLGGLFSLYSWVELYQEPREEVASEEMREVSTDRGQRSNLSLSDGSNITINAESSIRVPESFDPDQREIHLNSGEIYLEVAEDSERLFHIYSENAVVEVLGTSFSVRNYPEEDEVRVVVREGTVALANREDRDYPVTLRAEQEGRFNLQNGRLSSREVENLDLFLSWTEGYLKFEDEPLKNVVREIERRHNIQIEFAAPELKDLLLTAELKSRTTYNVLNVIVSALGIDYKQPVENRIVFFREENDEESTDI